MGGGGRGSQGAHWDGIQALLGVDVSAYPADPPQPKTTTITQTSGGHSFARTGPISGIGAVTVTSGEAPPPEGMVRADLTPFEVSAIQALRDMSANAASMVIEAMGLYTRVGNQMMLQDCLEGLRAEYERYMRNKRKMEESPY